MRVTRSQASQALDTVRRRRARASTRHRRPGRPSSAVMFVSPMTIERALRTIDALPRVRVALVEAASARLAAGERPSADAVADMAIRRATCDLLR
ncbi:MAG TPA: hypothetical protein VFP06_20365 [Acidimicrobiales bacterium]|nr:hypothetical protein [Acidimicrobiales bacterium]